jgi:cyclic nucleotide gated channel
MDDNLLNALCERLKPAYYTKGMYITSYGAPMYEMLFITNGELENVITSRGHTIFPNIGILGPGDFYGEELLTWALDPMLRNNLPTSTHTIRTLKEVDAFALSAEDLKFVVGQFQHLHDNQFQYISRFVLLILLLVIFC